MLGAGGKIRDAVEKLSSLDSILQETEVKIEEVKNTRMKITETEARLQDVSKTAEENIKLMGTLMAQKNNSGVNTISGKKAAGAPPIAVRENIIKLAHQGWKPAEIAASLNVSLGEVELTLDYFGKEG